MSVVRNCWKIPLFSPDNKSIKKIIRASNSLWKDALEIWVRSCFRPVDTLCLENALLVAMEKGPPCSPRGASHQVHLSASISPSVSSSGDLPPFNLSLHMQKQTQTHLLSQTFLPAQFWGKKHGLNGNALPTSIQRGECAYLSPNTVLKKRSLSLIAFGIYSNDLPRRVLRCQGFFISNISPNRIFVRIG